MEADSEETAIAATAAWIGQKLHELSPEFRAELVHLIEGMSNNARWSGCLTTNTFKAADTFYKQ